MRVGLADVKPPKYFVFRGCDLLFSLRRGGATLLRVKILGISDGASEACYLAETRMSNSWRMPVARRLVLGTARLLYLGPIQHLAENGRIFRNVRPSKPHGAYCLIDACFFRSAIMDSFTSSNRRRRIIFRLHFVFGDTMVVLISFRLLFPLLWLPCPAKRRSVPQLQQ